MIIAIELVMDLVLLLGQCPSRKSRATIECSFVFDTVISRSCASCPPVQNGAITGYDSIAHSNCKHSKSDLRRINRYGSNKWLVY
jgi:hypothetical protein